ncbi:MAG: YjbQ family protein [Chloroflexi bacterium]|nr:YjbQ family protein [Chloroflexota bacterium]
MISTQSIRVQTRGNCDIIDITHQVTETVRDSGLNTGTVTVFVAHSTCGITTVEYEPGLVSDLKEFFERVAPQGIPYGHDKRWGDGNGHSHVRASLLGCSLAIPFNDGIIILGTWQQVILVDFDNRSRMREIVFQIIGE